MPTISDCSHEQVMLGWEKLSTLFYVFLLKAKLANLSKYDSAANLLQPSSIAGTRANRQ